jgi:hypothetical protein
VLLCTATNQLPASHTDAIDSRRRRAAMGAVAGSMLTQRLHAEPTSSFGSSSLRDLPKRSPSTTPTHRAPRCRANAKGTGHGTSTTKKSTPTHVSAVSHGRT